MLDAAQGYTYAVCKMSNEDPFVSSMVRKQLLISVEQDRQLKTLSTAKSRSEGDLVREAVDAARKAASALTTSSITPVAKTTE